MKKHASLTILSLVLAIMLVVPTFLSATVYAESITADITNESDSADFSVDRGKVRGWFGDNAASTAYYGISPYGSDDITYLTVLGAGYKVSSTGYYTIYKTTTATGSVLNRKPVWTNASTKTVLIKMYYTADCSVTGCDDGELYLNGEAVTGSVKLYRGDGYSYTFTAKTVEGFAYSINGAEDGVSFTPTGNMTVSAQYISNKYATVSLSVGEGGMASIYSGLEAVSDKIPEGAGFEVVATPFIENGYYIDSIVIKRGDDTLEGNSVEAVTDGEEYAVTVTFAKASMELADMEVNLIDVQEKNYDSAEEAIKGAVSFEPEAFAEGATYKVEFVTATLLGEVYESLNYVPTLPTRHVFGESVPYGEIKAGNTEKVRVTCTNDAFPGITLKATATATLADLRIPTEIKSNSTVYITYGDDLKEAVCDVISITGDDGENVEFSYDDITLDPESLGVELLKTQDVTVKFAGNHDYAASEGTAKVYVKQASSSLDVVSESITYGETPALEVTTEPEDLDYLLLIAGVDTNVSGFISLYIPQSTRDKMKIRIAGVTVLDLYEVLTQGMKDGISFNELRNLIGNIDALVDSDLGDYIAESMNFDLESLRTIFDILTQIPEVDVNAKITIGNPPQNAGVYLVAAVSTDKNYKISADIGYLTIAPMMTSYDDTVELQFKNEIKNNFLTYEDALEFGFGGDLVVNGNVIESENIHASYFGITAEDLSASLTSTPITEPGTYTETIYAIGGNYLPKPISRIYTVGKKKVVINAPELSVPYDGNSHAIEYTVTPDTVDESKISVKYVGDGYNSSTPPTAAGVYTVYFSYAGNPTHLPLYTASKLTITKAEVTVDVYCSATVYYGQIGLLRGNPAGLKVNVTGVPEGEEFEATPYIVEDENFPHVGTYRVSANYTENDNYKVTVNEATLKIIPLPVEIVIDDAEKTYGDENPTFTFAIKEPDSDSDGLRYGETKERAKIAGITPSTAADKNAAPSTYDITANIGDKGLSDDYEVTSVRKGTLTVKPKSATVTIENSGKTYGGTDPELSFTLEGILEGDDAGVTLTRVEGEEVGTYEISGSASNTSYNFTFVGENGETGNFVISPKPVIIKINDATKVNGASDPKYNITVTDLDGNPVDPDEVGLKVTREEGEEDGDYKLKVELENGNYVIDDEFPIDAKLSIIPDPAKKDTIKPSDSPKSPETGYESSSRADIVFIWVSFFAVSGASLAAFCLIPFKKKKSR